MHEAVRASCKFICIVVEYPDVGPWRVNWREFYDAASADALKAWQLRVQQSDFAMMQCVKSRKSAYKAAT